MPAKKPSSNSRTLTGPSAKKASNKKRIIRWILMLLVLGAMFLIPRLKERDNQQEIGYQWSPDGQYKLVIYRVPNLLGTQDPNADSPAYVVLQNKNGVELESHRFSLLQEYQGAKWGKDAVVINDKIRWELPGKSTEAHESDDIKPSSAAEQ